MPGSTGALLTLFMLAFSFHAAGVCNCHLHIAVKGVNQLTRESFTPARIKITLYVFCATQMNWWNRRAARMILKRSAVCGPPLQNMTKTWVHHAQCSIDLLPAGGRQTAKIQTVLTPKLRCDTGLPAAPLLPLQHTVRQGKTSGECYFTTETNKKNERLYPHASASYTILSGWCSVVSIPHPRGLLSETQFLPRARHSWC